MTTDAKSDTAILLDVSDVAALLSCSVRHVWRMADGGHLPRPISIGLKLKRWPRKSIETWLADGCPAEPRATR